MGVVVISDIRANYDGHRCLFRKRCEIGRWLPRNVNRNSWVPDWMVQISMPVTDPEPGFKGPCILQNPISDKRFVSGKKLLTNTNSRSYTVCPQVKLSMTWTDVGPRCQGQYIFSHCKWQK